MRAPGATIAGSRKKTGVHYSSAFFSAADVANAAGRSGEYRALRFLGHVTSMRLRLDDPGSPVVPAFRMGTSRSAALEDFDAAQLALLDEFVPTVTDPELSARICDVLWLTRRDHVRAEAAIYAYLASAAALEDPMSWSECVAKLERASQVAGNLRRAELVDAVVVAIEGVLRRHPGTDPRYLSAKLMELLLKLRKGDPAACIAMAETAASASEVNGDLHRAATYLEIEASWQRRAGDSTGANKTIRRIGEDWAEMAEQFGSGDAPAFGQAVMHAQRALEALRRAGGTGVRRRKVHAALLQYQQGALGELKRIEVTRDVTALALSYEPRPVTELRKIVQEQAREHPMNFLFSSVVLTNQGRVAAQRGSFMGGTSEEGEAALVAEMCRHLTTHHQLVGQTSSSPPGVASSSSTRFERQTSVVYSPRVPSCPRAAMRSTPRACGLGCKATSPRRPIF